MEEKNLYTMRLKEERINNQKMYLVSVSFSYSEWVYGATCLFEATLEWYLAKDDENLVLSNKASLKKNQILPLSVERRGVIYLRRRGKGSKQTSQGQRASLGGSP